MDDTERQLLFGSYLVIKDKDYQIVETELYSHDDPYTNGDKQQYQDKTFYFHRINGKGFKEGSFKGMDITFGTDEHARAYLIRSIKDTTTGQVIEGPCLVVQTILKEFDHTKVKDFHAEYLKLNPGLSISQPESGLHLKPNQVQVSESQICCSPRVGLKFKAISGVPAETVLKYCMALYRYSTENLKKQSCTIKMSQKSTVYSKEREAGKKIAPQELYEQVKD